MKPFTFHVVTLLEPNNGNSKRTTAAISTPRVRVHPAMFKRVWTRNEPCPDGRAYTERLKGGQWRARHLISGGGGPKAVAGAPRIPPDPTSSCDIDPCPP